MDITDKAARLEEIKNKETKVRGFWPLGVGVHV